MPNKQLLQINIWIALYYIEIPEYNFQLSPFVGGCTQASPEVDPSGHSRIENRDQETVSNRKRNQKRKTQTKTQIHVSGQEFFMAASRTFYAWPCFSFIDLFALPWCKSKLQVPVAVHIFPLLYFGGKLF